MPSTQAPRLRPRRIATTPARRPTSPLRALRFAAPLLAALLALAGCERTGPPARQPTATEPAAAVRQLADDLRRHDLPGYARHAVPPALHARLEQAWREDRSRWPLTELPLHARFPAWLQAMSAPGAEKALLAAYQRQFAGAHGELRSASATIGLFATQYVRREGDYDADTREHYAQLINALSRWGQRAPLGDGARARAAIPRLVAAARDTGLGTPGALRELGMERSLQRLGPFAKRLREVALDYRLDTGATLAGLQVDTVEQDGDTARVRLRYTVAGQPIDAHARLQRIDGRWYLLDLLRHAEAAASSRALPVETPGAPGVARPR